MSLVNFIFDAFSFLKYYMLPMEIAFGLNLVPVI